MADMDPTFGSRLRHLRERRGLSREVFGGLVGRSGEWVKALENGRLLMPRLPMLLRIVDVLGIEDLAVLTGDQGSLPVETVTKGSHTGAPEVAAAMLDPVPAATAEPDVARLRRRIDDAWWLWHSSPAEKSAIAGIVPELLREARTAVQTTDGRQRRRSNAELSRAYTLAQAFLAWQPAGELVWLAADRSMAAAQAADDPVAIAPAARYYGEVYRSAGQPERARAVALDAADLLDPAAGTEQRARWGQLQLSAAAAEASMGNTGQAWGFWDKASEAAAALGGGYSHPWLLFGRADVDTYGIKLDVMLFRSGDALRRADQVDLEALPSRTRRAARLLDVAQAHSQRHEYAGVMHTLRQAFRESGEAVQFSEWARQALIELSDRRSVVRRDARELAAQVGLGGS